MKPSESVSTLETLANLPKFGGSLHGVPLAKLTSIQRQVLEQANNSSHFIWLFSTFTFFRTTGGWIFAYLKRGETVVISLDPLSAEPNPSEPLAEAFREFCRAVPGERYVWVGVQDRTLNALPSLNWEAIVVGQEPWFTLGEHKATGKAAHGVKSGRNQALKAGLRVEEIQIDENRGHPEVDRLYENWKNSTFVQMEGFLQTLNYRVLAPYRRYFVVRTSEKIWGFLVASPVKQRVGYYLEDIILDSGAPRGASALLVTTVFERLRETGTEELSMGVVPITSLSPHPERPPGPQIQKLLAGIKTLLQAVYNAEGLLLYRKRYRPSRWENIYFAISRADGLAPSRRDWLAAIFTVLFAHKPRWQLKWAAIRETLLRPLLKHPYSWLILAISTLNFALINHGRTLPPWALEKFGFHASASLGEWIERSLISDFLFFDSPHFYLMSLLLFWLIFQLERIYPRRFLGTVLFGLFLFDDPVDFLLTKAPLDYFHPKIFADLVEHHDVGPSLVCIAMLGMWLYSLKRWREPLFIFLTLGMVLGLSFTSLHLRHFFLNVNHVLFFGIGYLIARGRYEWERRQSQKVARGRPQKA